MDLVLSLSRFTKESVARSEYSGAEVMEWVIPKEILISQRDDF